MGVFDRGQEPNESALKNMFGVNGAIGEIGESYYARALKRAGITERYEVFQSLAIPGALHDARKMNTDVDIAVANGNNLILVDVKCWAAGEVYWSIPYFDKPLRGFTRLMKNGEWRLSQNMAMATERYSDRLPGVNVKAITVFVPTNARGDLPTSVRFLKFPGDIPSFLAAESYPYIYDYLGEPREVIPRVRTLLVQMKSEKEQADARQRRSQG